MLKKGVFILVLYLWSAVQLYRIIQLQKRKPLLLLKKNAETPSGVKITPYDHPDIQRKSLQVIVPQQKKPQRFNDDGSQLPAFKTLMQKLSKLTKPAMVRCRALRPSSPAFSSTGRRDLFISCTDCKS